MSQFSFEYPFVFLLLPVFWLCARYCAAKSDAIYFPHISRLLRQAGNKNRLLFWLKWIGIITMITALASPVITKTYKNNKKSARDIVLILDSSDSMRQRGFNRSNVMLSRFDAVKNVVKDFVDRRQSDRVGLVTFADVAFVASPLTFEKDFLKRIVKMQQLGMAGKRTAINDAILQTYSILSKSKTKSKIAILLTDGVEHSSVTTKSEIINLIENSHIKLYTIGIGEQGFFQGSIDHDYLKLLAKKGHGKYYNASESTKLESIYRDIDKLEKSKIDAKKIIHKNYYYAYMLFIAILSWLLFIYYRSTIGVSR